MHPFFIATLSVSVHPEQNGGLNQPAKLCPTVSSKITNKSLREIKGNANYIHEETFLMFDVSL
jgi:hypothetical protein